MLQVSLTFYSLVLWFTLANSAQTFAQDPPGNQITEESIATLEQQRAELQASADRFARELAEAGKLPPPTPALAPEDEPPATTAEFSISELERTLGRLSGKVDDLQESMQAALAEVKGRRERLAALPAMITAVETALTSAPSPSEPLVSATAAEKLQHRHDLAQAELAKQQLATLRAELALYRGTTDRHAAQHASDGQKLALLQNSVAAWQQRLDAERVNATGDAVDSTAEKLKKVTGSPVAEAIAAETANLAKLHGGPDGLSRRMSDASNRLVALEARRTKVAKQHAAAIRRVDLLEGANLPIDPATGQLLRDQRQKLSSQRDLRDQLRGTLRELAEVQIELVTHEERSAELAASEAQGSSDPPDIATLKQARGDQLKSLIADSRTHVTTLNKIADSLRSIASETGSFADFLDARLLWIRSAEPIDFSEPMVEAGALAELFRKQPFAFLGKDIAEAPLLWALAGIVVLGLLVRRRVYLQRLSVHGSEAGERSCTSYVPTAKALAYTVLIAAPLPALFLFIFARSGDAPAGVSIGLRNVAGFLTTTLTFKAVARPHGLMIDHFRIAEERVLPLQRNLGWLIATMPVLIFFATALPLEATASSAGRLFFIVLLLCLAVFFYLILRPSKKLITWRAKAPNHLARLCFALGIIAPLTLIAGAAAGFFASVQELRFQSLLSIWIIMVALFMAALLHRWILVSRRRLALQHAMEDRDAQPIATDSLSNAKVGQQPIVAPDDAQVEALKAVEAETQTGRLVRAAAITLIAFGLWGTWKSTVPALSALDKVTLWEEKSVPDESGDEEPQEGKTAPVLPTSSMLTDAPDRTGAPNRVTLQNLATALVTFLLTLVAARNIPGLLELTIFRRLHLSQGSNFALTTTIRYLIVVIGVVIALSMVDITWGKVQWIAAAITLGIGFGLQEIFANFVAGLIILFERPIRLGDVVTVGDVSGKVSQIRIRATTIRQFNSRELIVPNKEFITGKLVNWTLSDSMLRFEIIAGIAYGSDTRKATEILLKVAQENPKVLEEPAPDVLFDDFGDSALIFQLRAHVGNVDDLLPARNEVRYAIDDAFREAGIEIAFPQTDVHLKSSTEPASQDFKNPPEIGQV